MPLAPVPQPPFRRRPPRCRPRALAQTGFNLPGDGVANAGGFVGPFCCGGSTAVIRDTNGGVAGYVHFFSWSGLAFDTVRGDGRADVIYSDIRVSVNDTASGAISSVSITAAQAASGASRTVTAGRLTFTITITGVEATEFQGATYVYGSTLRARLTVSRN
ncbi:MAG: hypothetical protein IPG47_11225 [Thermoflexaceae bacterium]|nr:hypothetical protein [Thermoflexaceae bacterium]